MRFPFRVKWGLIAGVAFGGILLLTALQAVALLRRRRRDAGTDADLDELEFEFQQLLAEERRREDDVERLFATHP